MDAVHFSSLTCEWPTPDWLFDKLDREFGFTLDVCATPDNAKCKRYFKNPEQFICSPESDGLARSWSGDTCWMNPPYGRELPKWIAKAATEAAVGATVVALIPSRTDTIWWHKYCMAQEIRFIKGRLKFGGAKNSAPFPSAVVIFRPSAGRVD